MTWPNWNICSGELLLLLVLHQYLLPDKNILWKKGRAIKGHLTSHRRKTRWSLDYPALLMGLSSTIIHLLWPSCSEMLGVHSKSLRQRVVPRISEVCFYMIISAYSSFSETVWYLGKQALKWLRLKTNLLWFLRKWNKTACYSKSYLS